MADRIYSPDGKFVWTGSEWVPSPSFTYENGDRYEGEFKDWAFFGAGSYYHADGRQYDGDFRDSAANGRGVYTWPNGSRHEGEFKDGWMNGPGTLESGNGDRYEGEFKDGLVQGQGVFESADGDRYEGEFKDGVLLSKSPDPDSEMLSLAKEKEGEKPSYEDLVKLVLTLRDELAVVGSQQTSAIGGDSTSTLKELLMDNESQTLEFKASTWSEYHGESGELIDKQKSERGVLEDSVVKTIAGFLNTSGGTLLIGVKDKPRSDLGTIAEVLGIEPEYRWLKKGKRDTEGYEHKLLEALRNAFSNETAVQTHTTISFPVYEDLTICRVDVQPLPRNGPNNALYINTKKMGDDKFFTRSGDSTISNSMETAFNYIDHHFNHPRDKDQS